MAAICQMNETREFSGKINLKRSNIKQQKKGRKEGKSTTNIEKKNRRREKAIVQPS